MNHPPKAVPPIPGPGLPHDDAQEPVFQAPWEAKAFALVNQLATNDHCTWSEWTRYLADVIAATEADAPGSVAYYEQWVMACEQLLMDKGLLEPQAIAAKIAALQAEQATEHSH
jgi:nitrile hydratase accessory protein